MKRFVPFLLVLFLVSACASSKIDWNTRLNSYTYDQAIVELGPPDRSAKLSDGSTVAEWYEGHSDPSVGLGTGIGHGPVGVGIDTPVTSSRPDVLRLTFSPEGILRSANRN